MSEELFTNPSSEAPDELWRAPTPMQRQIDAAVLWAELTGKHASASADMSKTAAMSANQAKKLSDTQRWIASNPGFAGSMIGAPIGVVRSLRGSKEGPKGKSRREASLIAEMAGLDAYGGKDSSSIKKRILKARLRHAEKAKNNRILDAALEGSIGALSGGLSGRYTTLRRGKKVID